MTTNKRTQSRDLGETETRERIRSAVQWTVTHTYCKQLMGSKSKAMMFGSVANTQCASLHFPLEELGGNSAQAFGNTISGMIQVSKLSYDWSDNTFQNHQPVKTQFGYLNDC